MASSTQNSPELTQEQVVKILIKPLETQSKFLACGPRIFDTHSPIRIPKLGDVAPDLSWVSENALIPESEVDFDEVKLLPDTLDSVKVIHRFSNELARSSVLSLDAVLKDVLVQKTAAKIDTQFFSASGDGIETPKGIFAQSGIQRLTGAGALTLDVLLEAQAMAMEAEADLARMRWVFTPRDFSTLRGLKDTQGRYQLTPDPATGVGYTLFGIPVTVTKRLPNTTGQTPTGRALLADFSQIAVARDLAASVKILTERYADYDQQAIRVVSRMDLGVLNPEAVVAIEGIEL